MCSANTDNSLQEMDAEGGVEGGSVAGGGRSGMFVCGQGGPTQRRDGWREVGKNCWRTGLAQAGGASVQHRCVLCGTEGRRLGSDAGGRGRLAGDCGRSLPSEHRRPFALPSETGSAVTG